MQVAAFYLDTREAMSREFWDMTSRDVETFFHGSVDYYCKCTSHCQYVALYLL